MFRYKLKDRLKDKEWHFNNVVDDILSYRNLTSSEAKSMINPSLDLEENPFNYENMIEGVNLFKKHISNNSKIGVLVDCDVDGYMSSAMAYDFITNTIKHNKKVEYFIHEGKVHGLEDIDCFEKIKESNLDLLIIPDASTSEYLYHKKLNDLGIDIIVLDHHEPSELPLMVAPQTIIINNQLSITNKHLSGTGVTFKFIKAICNDIFNNPNVANKYYDLVAISLISDVMDLKTLSENNLYLIKGTLKENIHNSLIKVFFNQQEKDYLNFNDIAFNISSSINAIIRVGNLEDKEILFKALCNIEEDVIYSPRGKSRVSQSIQEAVVRISNNKKSKQKRDIDKIISDVKLRIENKDLLRNKVLIIDMSEYKVGSLGGIIAIKLASEYKRPVILLKGDELGNYSGSARGYEKCGVSNFKDICENTNLTTYCKGHQEAFGISVHINNLASFIEKLNTIFKDIENEDVYTVDKVYDNFNFNELLVDMKEVSNLDRLWSSYIEEPIFIIKGIKINTKDIEKIGNATYTFKYQNIKFTKNFGSKNWYFEFSCKHINAFGFNDIEVDLIGRFRKNKYGYYIEIENTHSRKIENSIIF